MAKQKKKRTKRYTGQDSKLTRPSILKVQAEERGAFKEWWTVWGKAVKVLISAIAVIIAIVILLIGIIDIFI